MGGARGRRLRATGLACLVATLLALGLPVLLRLPADTADAVPGTAAAAPAPADVATAVRTSGALAWRTVALPAGDRRYLLATPPEPGPRPLLVVLHGLNQRTEGLLAATGIVAQALAAGVAVAGPETPDAAWNDGRFGRGGRDDDAYVVALVDQLVAAGVADGQRVALAGFSNGAGLSMELSARHPDRFSALVLVGGELLEGIGQPRPDHPVPTVLVHGTDDPIQPWQGRARRGPRMPAQIGVPATVAAFVAAAGAGPAQPVQELPHTAGRIRVTVERWPGPVDVTLYRLVGAGHVWPVEQCPAGACRPSDDVARLADVSASRLAVEAALRTAVPVPTRTG